MANSSTRRIFLLIVVGIGFDLANAQLGRGPEPPIRATSDRGHRQVPRMSITRPMLHCDVSACYIAMLHRHAHLASMSLHHPSREVARRPKSPSAERLIGRRLPKRR
jgi:hypothetical protein